MTNFLRSATPQKVLSQILIFIRFQNPDCSECRLSWCLNFKNL